MKISDEYLEQLGSQFVESGAHAKLGLRFADYVAAELRRREQALVRLRSGLYLHAQRNGRFFERLHHHRQHARNALARFGGGT